MKFKIGEKVNFLNENGGGKVLKIIDSKLVLIETHEGFEMPVLGTELISDYRAQEEIKPQTEFFENKYIDINKTEEEEVVENVSEINPWGSVREEKGIYFAFEPHEQQWVLTGDIDIFIVNHTSYDILYSLFMEVDGQLEGVDFSSVPPDSKINIATINRDEIENWIKGYVQILFHSDMVKKVYFPLHSVIDAKANRFFKEGSYRSNTLLDGKAILMSIAPENTLEVVTNSGNENKFGSKTKAGIAEAVKDKPLIDKHKRALGEAVVDLHIAELLDNILGLSSHDMLTTQIDYFKKALESAMTNDYSKVTFIHGVGNGVLKNSIISELENYRNTQNQMASISKFGVGAFDVLIESTEE